MSKSLTGELIEPHLLSLVEVKLLILAGRVWREDHGGSGGVGEEGGGVELL